jgi:hypothetical protein
MKDFMRIIKNIIFLLVFSLTISSCALLQKKNVDNDSDIKAYADDKTKFDIRKALNGNLKGFGVWQNAAGKVIKKFTIEVNGTWEDNKGVVKKSYVFEDGSKDSRTWLITVDDENNYVAIGHDIVGDAVGKQYGGASKMNYILSIKDGSIKSDHKVEDWTYAVNDKSFINILNVDKVGNEKIIISLKKSND